MHWVMSNMQYYDVTIVVDVYNKDCRECSCPVDAIRNVTNAIHDEFNNIPYSMAVDPAVDGGYTVLCKFRYAQYSATIHDAIIAAFHRLNKITCEMPNEIAAALHIFGKSTVNLGEDVGSIV